MTQNFKKIVRIGYSKETGNTYCRIEFKDGRLSITGVEGPLQSGNCEGSCGQIVMGDWHFNKLAPGWSSQNVEKFREIWDRWHLNDMAAGSPRQEEFLRKHPVEFQYPESHFGKAKEALRSAQLEPDLKHMVNGKPYRYGTAWLSEDVPADVLEFLISLPDTDRDPAWV